MLQLNCRAPFRGIFARPAIRRYHFQKPLSEPRTRFTGKTIVVTGANSGLGFEAAAKFTALDASRVILAVRDIAKGQQAKTAIEERTGIRNVLEVWPLDMESYSSIWQFAHRCTEDLRRLDVAVLNAGVFNVGYATSPQGWENTIQVNVLSTALLAQYLLPKMKDTGQQSGTGEPPVLTFVSSRRHEKVVFHEDELDTQTILQSLNDPERYNSSRQYQISKLLVMCVMQKLAAIVGSGSSNHEPDVVINAVCPGFCRSNLSRGHQGLIADTIRLILNTLVLRTAEEGARSLVSAAALGVQSHGRFWYDDELYDSSHPLLSKDDKNTFVENVWERIQSVLAQEDPNFRKVTSLL
ncbi:hypothetical protein PV08_09551 [Exophiala spinifera]|uniref:Uncharacterized protein n=1 Tax=Exophiala spinifera TaxID=91928 RepID=A0A0D2BM56_9EURO|nr:uncharacterized protein PV08_09551 [Exophiala spinifera]KIW12274.1 hypothetical protein PV08_09551 [Exophiala spinifera]